jgi:hypothetical protein
VREKLDYFIQRLGDPQRFVAPNVRTDSPIYAIYRLRELKVVKEVTTRELPVIDASEIPNFRHECGEDQS